MFKIILEVAFVNNLTNRPSVGRNTKRFSEYSLNLLCCVRVTYKYRYDLWVTTNISCSDLSERN